jgi:hypothetical protein
VTATCGTCHGLFGDAAPIPDENGARFGWTDSPPDLTQSILGPTVGARALPTASQYAAYQKNMRAAQFVNPDGSVNTTNVDAIPGHSLGIMLDGTPVRVTDDIPSGTNPLVVMASGMGIGEFPHAYEAGVDGMPRYSNEPATSYEGTKGLNCASCHTPHGTVDATDATDDGVLDNTYGEQLFDPLPRHNVMSWMLLSSRPNHTTTPVVNYEEFCISCHDQKALDTGAGDTTHQNHPPFCTSCHANPKNDTSSKDFPHTSSNPYLLSNNGDGMCVGCHPKGTLP